MDPTSAVRTDALPVIATVVAPGAFASAPYAWLCLSKNQDLRVFLNGHEAIAVAAAILLWVVVGFAVESLGSYVEVYRIDRRRSDHQRMLDDWWRYLRIAWEREPIGQRYLRRLLVSFKFELNMCVATALSVPGILWIAVARYGWWPGVLPLLLLGGTALLFCAARGTAEVLDDVRSRLLMGVGEPPFDTEGNPAARRH